MWFLIVTKDFLKIPLPPSSLSLGRGVVGDPLWQPSSYRSPLAFLLGSPECSMLLNTLVPGATSGPVCEATEVVVSSESAQQGLLGPGSCCPRPQV